MNFVNILKHGALYGRRVVFTCRNCGCQYEKLATEVRIGRERIDDENDWIIFSNSCPECLEFVSKSEPYKDWFK